MRRLVACLWILAALVAAVNGAVSLGRSMAMAREPREPLAPVDLAAARIRAKRSDGNPILFIAPLQATRDQRYEALRTELRLKYLVYPTRVDVAPLPLTPHTAAHHTRIVTLSCPPRLWPRGARVEQAFGPIVILDPPPASVP
jgi:hypothetical protein